MSAPTRDEVREHVLIDNFPPDSRQLLDFDNSRSNVYLEADAIAGAVKAHAFDPAAQMVTETLASTATSGTGGMLANHEQALGLASTTIAQAGSDAQRQAQVTARMRENASSSPANILAILQALCGSVAVTVLEQSRSDRRDLNTYSLGVHTVPSGTTSSSTLAIGDNAPASQMGAQLIYNVSSGDTGEFQITVTAPDAQSKAWQSEIIVDGADHTLFWAEFAGGVIDGTWVLQIDNSLGGTHEVQVDRADLFVEGIGRASSGAEGRAAPVFVWVALVDTALASTFYDAAAVRETIRRINPAHCRGYLAQKNGAGGTAMRCDDPLTPCDGGLAG